MNNQEAFEISVKHMFAQGQQANIITDGVCRYRTDTGLKCAVGALIPDDQYDESLEFNDVVSLMETNRLLFLKGVDPNFLMELQNIHDDIMSWNDEATFKNMLLALAEEFNLDSRFVNDLTLNKVKD